MIDRLQHKIVEERLWIWALVVSIVLGAAGLSYIAPTWGLILLVVGLGGLVLLQYPHLGPFVIVGSALFVPIALGTGTEVALNAATLMVPVSLGVWAIDMIRRGQVHFAGSRTNSPLLLFLVAGLLSLLIGSATWDPAVPRSGKFLIVQLAQWAVFAFAAGAFWLTANLEQRPQWLRRLTFFYLALAGGVAMSRVLPGGAALTRQLATFAVERASFWALLVGVAGGQLLFNRQLSSRWRLFLGLSVAAVSVYAFVLERATASNWVGVVAVLGVLVWLRWPKLRWLAIVLLLGLAVTGVLSSAIYEFAGGDAEWVESGGSRLALFGRVIEVTMRNPITGLGPAAYRLYARMTPLLYGRAFWVSPSISSHNNYVDLFSHAGLLGLSLFMWFAVEVLLLGFRLRPRFTNGFESGLINGMLAAWAGSLVLMLFADWILPFVYNIGFQGFQASVLVWLLLGGLVALENTDASEPPNLASDKRGS